MCNVKHFNTDETAKRNSLIRFVFRQELSVFKLNRHIVK